MSTGRRKVRRGTQRSQPLGAAPASGSPGPLSTRSLPSVAEGILEARRAIPQHRSVLVAVTGIDGCGKGYVAAKLVDAVEERGFRVASIHADGWLNLPHRRFAASSAPAHFYEHAIRFDELFALLVLPLRDRRSVHVEVDHVEETAREYRRVTYDFQDIDVIILEGIFLLKRSFQRYYDFSCWIDCAFETALERAIARGQEALPPEETVLAYRTIYFPAQEIHFERDDPRRAASTILDNDHRPNR